MDLNKLFSGGAICHDSIHFPNTDVRVSVSDTKQEITHTLKDGIAIMSFSNNYYMGQSPFSIESYSKYIYNLKADSNVSGLIFEQYSGGGNAISAALMKQTFEDFKKSKPVINLTHAAGSAAFWAATGSNLIIASSDMAQVGSIGAVMSLDKFARMIDMAFMKDVYAEQSPDKNLAERNWYEDEDNVKLYQEMANEAATIFIDTVKVSRPYVKPEALTGKMYSARDAKRLGLIDGIGSIEYAQSRMKSLLADYK